MNNNNTRSGDKQLLKCSDCGSLFTLGNIGSHSAKCPKKNPNSKVCCPFCMKQLRPASILAHVHKQHSFEMNNTDKEDTIEIEFEEVQKPKEKEKETSYTNSFTTDCTPEVVLKSLVDEITEFSQMLPTNDNNLKLQLVKEHLQNKTTLDNQQLFELNAYIKYSNERRNGFWNYTVTKAKAIFDQQGFTGSHQFELMNRVDTMSAGDIENELLFLDLYTFYLRNRLTYLQKDDTRQWLENYLVERFESRNYVSNQMNDI